MEEGMSYKFSILTMGISFFFLLQKHVEIKMLQGVHII